MGDEIDDLEIESIPAAGNGGWDCQKPIAEEHGMLLKSILNQIKKIPGFVLASAVGAAT